MPDKSITVLPYRLIPCDFGHELNKKIFESILSSLQKSGEWAILNRSDKIEGEILEAKLRVADNSKPTLYLHLYSDGLGVFSLIDKEQGWTYETFDPDMILYTRKCAHRDLLKHKHELSDVIDKTISNVRSLFSGKSARISAHPMWENKGLSYVMSFYFINVPIEMIEDIKFQEKLALLLFPYYEEKPETDYSDKVDVEKHHAMKKFRENFLMTVKQDYEILPNIHTCASWSNFLIIGKITVEVKSDYWRLERELQHTWFYTYITEKFIEHSLKNIYAGTPEKELEILDTVLTEMMFKINQYEGIVSSTLHERYFRLYEALRKSSRLDLLITNVEKKAQLLRNRYNWLLNEKRLSADRKIQFILFLIAIISSVGAYNSFEKLGLTYSFIVVLLSVLFGIYFFKLFFRMKEKVANMCARIRKVSSVAKKLVSKLTEIFT